MKLVITYLSSNKCLLKKTFVLIPIFFFNKHFRDDFHRIIHEAQLVYIDIL